MTKDDATKGLMEWLAEVANDPLLHLCLAHSLGVKRLEHSWKILHGATGMAT